MKVFKFGGASIQSTERIKNTAAIIQEFSSENILVIISAMGKTTNDLENVVTAFCAGNKELALSLFEKIKENHINCIKSLVIHQQQLVESKLKELFTEVEWLLHDKPVREFDYYYDQIVSIGELLSTCIISHYLTEINLKNAWVDVRDIVRTDNNFRDATIQWNETIKNTKSHIEPLFNDNNIVITQGYIGATDQNESTTLGREGSDYSAAIFANILNADCQTIWKDVEAVMSADPRVFKNATNLAELSYNEVIEMAYYGAQVIHPKTIKPLQNKNIPLFVKCFLNPNLPGTIISNKPLHHLPPIIVLKNNQVMMELSSKDFSFVGEVYMSKLYEIFSDIKISPNILQSGAISILCALDDVEEKIEKIALQASEIFDVQIQKGLTLLTIRHYTNETIEEQTKNKQVLLEQKTTETIQVLMK